MAKNSDLSVVNLPSATPKPPANLGPAGINLWRSIMAEYDGWAGSPMSRTWFCNTAPTTAGPTLFATRTSTGTPGSAIATAFSPGTGTGIGRRLNGHEIGDGLVGRVAREAQRQFLRAPELEPKRVLWDRDAPQFERASKRAF